MSGIAVSAEDSQHVFEWTPTVGSKEIAELDRPFEAGARGWARQRGNLGGTFTITAVDAGRRWVSECPVPLGKVVFDHVLEPLPGGRVRVVKRAEAVRRLAAAGRPAGICTSPDRP
jgi:hypothetical protein